jgi:nitrite reductase (NADH) small subunit
VRDAHWIRVATTESIPRREGRAVSLGGRELAIFNLGDRFLTVENRCPHQGGPLADGIVSGCAVVCPLHAWRVRLDSGDVERPGAVAACVRTFATRVEGDIVMVQLPEAADTPDGAERAA